MALAASAAVGLAASGVVALAGASSAAVGDPLVYGLTATNQIVSFNVSSPGTIRTTSPVLAVSGDLEGIDVRPATGELYGLVNGAAGDLLAVIDPVTGVVREIPLTAGTSTAASGNLEGDEFGFDFNPVIDRIRVVSNTRDNYVVNPVSGVIQAKQADLFRAGDLTRPDVRGAAYTNNVATQTATTTGTTLYDIDIEGPDVLRTQNATAGDPNIGQLTAVGTVLGTDVPTSTTTTAAGVVDGAAVGFDIEARTDNAYAVLQTGAGTDQLFAVNLATGTVGAPLGDAGGAGTRVEDIAIASPRLSLQSSGAGREGDRVTLTVTRSGDAQDALTVPFTASGTPTVTTAAASAADFTPGSGVVTFAPAATQTAITFSLAAADGVEGAETFEVVLGQPSTANAAVTAANRAVVTIADDGRAAGPVVAPRLGIAVSPATTTPGVVSVVTVTGRPGTEVELSAYSRPETRFRVVRRGLIPESGALAFRVTPGTNTRLFAAVAGQTGNESPSVVINVRTAASLTVVRNGSADYTFQGRVLPRRAGQLVTLYRVTADGREVITSQARTDDTGTYRIRRVFVGQGTFGFLVRTGQTLTNAAGVSNEGRARQTAIYVGPQR